MRKILNPFSPAWRDEYNCIGCSPQNEIGFHLQFYDNDDELIAGWIPEKKFMGYPDVIHGGIQSTLLDEIGGWAVYVKCETVGVTQEMTITFHHPLRITKGETTLKCRLIERKEKQAILHAELFDGEGRLCSEAKLTYYIDPQDIAEKRFNYPGVKAFYEEARMEEKTKDNTTEPIYTCKSCNWRGTENELDYDETETCAGPDKIEVCPKCGSMDVRVTFEMIE
jgi:uncharacterized protein (TIGR00369 family)